jgi:hypothetical protein
MREWTFPSHATRAVLLARCPRLVRLTLERHLPQSRPGAGACSGRHGLGRRLDSGSYVCRAAIPGAHRGSAGGSGGLCRRRGQPCGDGAG